MSHPTNENIVWHETTISRDAREQLVGHRGAVVWFTGLSGSGKSTIAHELEARLNERNIRTYSLDGDNVRHGLNGDLGFAPEDRTENIRRIGEVAGLFADAGVIALVCVISPYRADRDRARTVAGDGRFVEVFVDCPVETCESRDPKGLYVKARAGEIGDFTGISAPYEAPETPEVSVRTDMQSPEACVEQVLAFLEQAKLLSLA